MVQQRPGILTAIAIVNIVVGGIALLGGFLGGLIFYRMLEQTSTVPAVADLLKAMDRAVPGWIYIEMAKAGLVFVLGGGLVIASIGLLMRPAWGRWYCISYGILAMVLHSGYLAFEIGWVKPVADGWAMNQRRQMETQRRLNPRAPAPPNQDQAFAAGVDVGMYGAAALFISHGLVLLIIVTRRDIVQFFAPPKRVRGPKTVEAKEIVFGENDVPVAAIAPRLAGEDRKSVV